VEAKRIPNKTISTVLITIKIDFHGCVGTSQLCCLKSILASCTIFILEKRIDMPGPRYFQSMVRLMSQTFCVRDENRER